MDSFKKNIEGTWKVVPECDENLEAYMKGAGVTDDEAKMYCASKPTFNFTAEGDKIKSWNVPFPDKPDMKMEASFELGKEFDFENPLNKKVMKLLMCMDGDKMIETIEPVTDKNAKKTKMVITRNGDKLELVSCIFDNPSIQCKRVFSKA